VVVVAAEDLTERDRSRLKVSLERVIEKTGR